MGWWIWVIRSISASIRNEFARGNCHIDGIESFRSYAKRRPAKFTGASPFFVQPEMGSSVRFRVQKMG